MNHAVFLDLNGTLIPPIPINQPYELNPMPGTELAVAQLSRAGFLCPVVTVQSRIAEGLFTEVEFRRWFKNFVNKMKSAEAILLGPYVCPHALTEPCVCKKPNTYLYEMAAQEHSIDLKESYVIGDTASDVLAAMRFGGRGCWVRTGWRETKGPEPKGINSIAAYSGDSLQEIVEWILSQNNKTDSKVL